MAEIGVNLPVPASFARVVAEDAVRRAKARGSARGWKSVGRLRPLWAQGQAGIRDPLHFLKWQDSGTQPRIMKELEGKVVPIKDKATGKKQLITVKDVGKPGWGGPPGARVWKQQKWRHPGIKPTHFMRDSLDEAIKANKSVLSERLKRAVEAGDHDFFLR